VGKITCARRAHGECPASAILHCYGIRTALRTRCVTPTLEVQSKRDRARLLINSLLHIHYTTGEALNVDLTDFTTQLYTLIPSLCLAPPQEFVDAAPTNRSSIHTTTTTASAAATTTTAASSSPLLRTAISKITPAPSTSVLLFRALHLAFAPRVSVPPWRAAAFAKRLLSAALHWPSAIALRALEFVARLVASEPRLEALLSTEDRTVDGVYRPDVEDPQLCNPFATSAYELHLLQTAHVDARVREAAANLANYVHA
jgi:nucleolar complex protein 3